MGRNLKYKLDYLNYEVRQSLNMLLECAHLPGDSPTEVAERVNDLAVLMMKADVEKME